MLSKNVLCFAVAAPMTVLLHGCGGGDSTTSAPNVTTTPSPSPSPSPQNTTTSPAPAPTPPAPPVGPPPPTPWDPATAVDWLNKVYMNFDETNDASALGVTISMAGQVSSFDDNLFCEPLTDTTCYEGHSDCAMSACILNHKVMVNQNKVSPAMDRAVGYVFNQNLVETDFGKCAYIWDGANFNALNGRCGAGAAGKPDCDDPLSAFANQCTHDGEPHTCTRNDYEITSKMCKCEPPLCDETYGSADPPATNTDATCFYEMPSLITDDPTQTSHLRDMLKQRIALQAADATLESNWNEVVIDDMLLIPKVRKDPTNTIMAFVCIPSNNPSACDLATKMRDDFHEKYQVTGVPVVAIDTTVDFTTTDGPFILPPDSMIFA